MADDVPDDNQLRSLTDGAPERHDLFIGLVAPIGSNRDDVRQQLEDKLNEYGYDMERIHLASLLDDIPGWNGDPLPRRSEQNYHKMRMDAGDDLRMQAGDHSALAALGVVRATEMRRQRKEDERPVAYVFDSLKHPREALLLRNVYGTGFWLVAIVQDIEERRQNLSETLSAQSGQFGGHSESQVAVLIERDGADPNAVHGQQVRDVFAAADFFLPVRRGDDWVDHLDRFLQGVFDAPFLTPTIDEDESPWFPRRLGLLDFDQGLVAP